MDSTTNWECALICLSDNILSFMSPYGLPRCEITQMALPESVLIVLPQVTEGLVIAGVITVLCALVLVELLILTIVIDVIIVWRALVLDNWINR